MEFVICLRSVADVQEFVTLATTKPYAVTVGNSHHRANGKNFMEMFCLDYAQPLTVRCDCTLEEYERFRQEAERFLR